MTILEAENQTLRRRLRDIETEFRGFKETYARLVEENAQLKDRIKVLERQLQPGLDGRVHERIDAAFRIDGVNSRGEAAMGVARNVSIGGVLIETDLRLLPGERMTITFELLGRPFKVQAEVMRVSKTGFGVKFDMDAQKQAFLREVLSRL
jgi:hypothetical protein